ncbi:MULTISPECIES: hypothetical protein [unclassified Variovorax]|uniref:hypothetical protein n=1 Tax=unclassified Variovorax TaxID=663243 RepID=UPI001119C00B|nr:hypothetical protein [Variovorax sp. KBS0712]TSD61164.1 hypothetical protein FFI97_013240 [Variovorax sp. KBS0712]
MDEQNTSPPEQKARSVSDPREVAALIMSRIGMVNAKKDELTIAIKALSDATQQLSRAYSAQMLTIDRLVRRVKLLEAAAAGTARGMNGNGAQTPAAAQDQRAD